MRELRRLLGYLRPYLFRMLLAAVLVSVSGALMAAVLATLNPLVNEVFLGRTAVPWVADVAGDPGLIDRVKSAIVDLFPVEAFSAWTRANAFVQVPLMMVGIFFVRGILLYFGNYQTMRCGASVIRDLRVELTEKITYQSLDFFQENPSGVIASRVVSDVQRLQRVATTVLADLLRVGGMVPFVLLGALLADWKMSLLSFAGLPLLSVPMIRLGRRLRKAATGSQLGMTEVMIRLQEAVMGVKVVQGFGKEQFEIGRMREALQRMLRADLQAARAQALSPAIMELLGALLGAGLFYIAGRSIADGTLDGGRFTVVLASLGILFVSIRRLNRLYAEIQVARSAAVRVFDMLDREPSIREREDAHDLPIFESEIAFDGVSFNYGDGPVLHDINLVVRRGETIALVGRSGSGKSTLANLVPRFYDATGGVLRIDGHNVCDVKLHSLRNQIGVVTQETLLFDETVRHNIAYGSPEISFERIQEVARAAQAEAFIEALPEGYDTMLGERGTRLSMGQRQRITIARALLKDPPILILDEATSALDAESESAVQAALERLLQGRTSIVIAHRLSTIRRADRIVVLDAGRIVEQGTHDELLARSGIYKRLHDLQFENPST